MQYRDLGAALAGFTSAFTWQATLRFLMEPSAMHAALLVFGLVLFLIAVAVYVTTIVKRTQPQPSHRRAPRSAKQTKQPAATRSSGARQASPAEAPAAA